MSWMADFRKWTSNIVGDQRIHIETLEEATSMLKCRSEALIFKPASHRTSMSLAPEDTANTAFVEGAVTTCPLSEPRSSGTYKELPEEIRDSVVPPRKEFPDTQIHLRNKAERHTKTTSLWTSVPTDPAPPPQPAPQGRRHNDHVYWKTRAELKKANLEAAKYKCGRPRSTLSSTKPEVKLSSKQLAIKEKKPPASAQSSIKKEVDVNNEADFMQMVSSKGFETIVYDDDYVVMVNASSNDRNFILRKLIRRLLAKVELDLDAKDFYNSRTSLVRQSSAMSAKETMDMYIDDDDVLTSENVANFPNLFNAPNLLTSASSDAFQTSPSDLNSSMQSDDDAASAAVSSSAVFRRDDQTGQLVVSIPAEVGYSTSIQVHANYEGVKGKHLITTSYKSLKTGDTQVVRRIASASSVIGEIKSAHAVSGH